jgi:hypothetical protein
MFAQLPNPKEVDVRLFYLFVAVALAVAVLRPARARGDEAPQKDVYVLKADGTVEKRVAAVESEVAALKARIAALEAAAKPTVSAAAPVQYRQVCENGVCRLVPVSSAADCPCGPDCPCPLGQCGAAGCPTAGFTGQAGSSPTAGRTGLFPNRPRLFGRRTAGGCASCGQ